VKVFIGANWYFVAAAGLLMAAFIRALKRSSGLPPALRVLRFSAAALAALLLTRPYAVFYRQVPVKPVLAVLLDASLYMREGPAGKSSGISKYDQAAAWLGKYRAELGGVSDPECYAFSDRLYKVDCSSLAAAGSGSVSYSDLGRALSELDGGDGARDGSCPDKVWVLSDGLSLSGKAPPLPAGCTKKTDIVAVGETVPPRGISVTRFSGPPFAFAHIPFWLSAAVRVSGMKGSRFELRLKDGAGNTLETRKYEAGGQDETVISSFSVSAPSVGRAAYAVCAAPGPGAGCSAAGKLQVSVIREKLRVMYLAGRPSFEYAFLRDHLKSQSGIDLVSFIILRNPEDMPGADERELSLIPFPVNEIFLRDISHFDVFILQDFDLRRFAADGNYAASLAEFVRKGGGLAVLGGPSAFGSGGYRGMDFLNAMLPAEVAGGPDYRQDLEFRVSPASHTASDLFPGMENKERFWAGAPPLKGVNVLGPLKSGAKAVFYYKDPAAGRDALFSAEKSYGKGRVMVLAGPSTWRWKMLGAADARYAGLYSAFWGRTLAYLDGSLSLEKVALESLPRSGQSRAFRLKVLNANYLPPSDSDAVSVDASLEAGGKVVPVEFSAAGRGIYEAAFAPAESGRNRLRVSVKSGREYLGSAEAVFEAEESPVFTPSDEEVLKKTAAGLGGGYYRLDPKKGPEELLKSLPPEREGRREASRFDPDGSLAVMLLAAALFFASWILGRLKGLQ